MARKYRACAQLLPHLPKVQFLKRIIFFLLLAQSVKAQVSVVASSGSPTGSYTSLKLAFDAINFGVHQGNIKIVILSSITETATAKLYGSGGNSNYTSIKILPTIACTISGDIADALIDLNGADSVDIDGRIGGTGSVRNLTISNSFSTSNNNTSTIRLVNGAQHNVLHYLNIEGSGQSNSSGSVWIMNSNNSETNSYNIIDHNEIKPAGSLYPVAGIRAYHNSTTGSTNTSNHITNNLVHDFFSLLYSGGGIVVEGYNTDYSISGNSIYQEQPKSGTPASGQFFIRVTYGQNHSIANNFIGGSAPGAQGAPATYSGKCYVTGIWILSVTNSQVDSNIVTNFNIAHGGQNNGGGATFFLGIAETGGTSNIRHNTIGSPSDTSAIVVSCSGGTSGWGLSAIWLQGTVSPDTYTLSGNSIGGLSATGSSTAESFIWTIYVQDATTLLILNNIIGGKVPQSIQNTSVSGGVSGIVMHQQANSGNYSCTQNVIQNLYNRTTGDSNATVEGIVAGLYGTQTNGNQVTTKIGTNIVKALKSANTNALNGSLKGIYLDTFYSSPNCFMNTNVVGNEISDFVSSASGPFTTVIGFSNECPFKTYLNIDSNTITGLKNGAANPDQYQAASVQGISSPLISDGPLNIRANKIYDLESIATTPTSVIGINCFHGSNTKPATVAQNTIYDLRNSTSTNGIVKGIAFRGGGGTGTLAAENNMISLSAPGAEAYGIVNDLVATKINLYYNSVALGGTTSLNNRSAAFYRSSATSAGIQSLNNIFYNFRTGGTAHHYALVNASTLPATGWNNSNFNNLYSSSPSTIASWNGTDLGFSAYQSTSMQDSCSVSALVDFTSVDTANLHLLNTATNQSLAGIALTGVTTDFDDDARHSIPSMGADEIVIALTSPVITALGAVNFCRGDSVALQSATPGIQWYKDGVAISGAVGSIYYAYQSGNYSVHLIGNCHPLTSNSITVVVNPTPAPPVISALDSLSFCTGDSVVLQSSAAFNQWYKDGTAIPGATAQTYTARLSGLYSATTTINNCTSLSGTSVSVIVYSIPPPPVITPIEPVILCEGDSVILTSSATYNQWYRDGITISGAIAPDYIVFQTGLYSVAATTTNQCISSPSIPISVTVYALPPTPVITLAGSILQSSTPTGNQWFLNGVIIPGATGQQLQGGQGVYTVQVTLNGCASEMSAPFDFTAKSILLFPNPVGNVLKLKITGYNETMSLAIYDAQGRKVKERIIIATNFSLANIQIGNLTPGTFELILSTSDGIVHKRFIKL